MAGKKAQKRARRLAAAVARGELTQAHLDGDRANVIGNRVIHLLATEFPAEAVQDVMGGVLAAAAYVVRQGGVVEEDAVSTLRMMLTARMAVLSPSQAQA